MCRFHANVTILVPECEKDSSKDSPESQWIVIMLNENLRYHLKVAFQSFRPFSPIASLHRVLHDDRMLHVVNDESFQGSASDSMHFVTLCRKNRFDPRKHSRQSKLQNSYAICLDAAGPCA